MHEVLPNVLNSVREKLGLPEGKFTVEYPADFSHGDYSTNIALVLAKKISSSPREVAEKFKIALLEEKIPNVEGIEIAGPGFINFFITPDYFKKNLERILKEKEQYGKNSSWHGKTVMVEYTDPNPFKEFHIGHLMPNVIGEALTRLYEMAGAQVIRANYQGDVGLHVAKALWGKMKNPELQWGAAYASGARAYEEELGAKAEIENLNKTIYDRSDEKVNVLYDQGRKDSLARFEEIYKTLGTKFDVYYFESQVGGDGLDIVRTHPDIFEESDGAIVFHGEKYDSSLHTRVFVNKIGLPTYEAKELGLNVKKFTDYDLDKSVVVTANEINDYFRVLLKALERIDKTVAEKTEHIGHGVLRLPSGKMGSRTGNVITGESLIEDVRKLAREKMKTSTHLSKDEQEKVATDIAVGAIKYSILKQGIGKDIIFDFEKSLSFEGDSGPYLQYTHSRSSSILARAEEAGIETEINHSESGLEILKYLERFPSEVTRALNEYAPQRIITYLVEIAALYNAFYANNKIIDSDHIAESAYRVALTDGVRQVLKNGLWLLGVRAPERM